MTTLPRPPASWTSGNPSGLIAPGGFGFPDFTDTVAGSTPLIGYITDMTYADETLGILGTNLTTNFVIWTEGQCKTVTSLRYAATRAQVVIQPKNQSRSVAIIWPKNTKGYGVPVRINEPEIYWIWPDRKLGVTDREIRIMGKDLFFPMREPVVVVQRNSDVPVEATITSASNNEIIANLPSGFATGTYTVWVHNGTGGKYGCSNSDTLTVIANPYNVATTFAVDSQSGTTDQAKLDNAVAAALANGGGTVVFAARTYTLTSASMNYPSNAYTAYPVVFQGAGIYQTILQKNTWPEKQIFLKGAGSEVRDLKCDGVRISMFHKDQTCLRVNATANDAAITVSSSYNGESNTRGSWNLCNAKVHDCIITGINNALNISTSSDVWVKGNTIRCSLYDYVYDINNNTNGSTNTDNHGISIRGSNRLRIEDNIFESLNASTGRIMTRAMGFLWADDSCVFIKGNTMRWVGGFKTCIAAGRDDNTGEQIMFHGFGAGFEVTVVSATSTTVVINLDTTTIAAGGYAALFGTPLTEFDPITQRMIFAQVVTGRCSGQAKRISSLVDAGSGNSTVTIDGWDGYTPQAGDRLFIRPINYHNIIVGNKIDPIPNASGFDTNFGRVGVLFYTSAAECIVADNDFRSCQHAVNIFTSINTPVTSFVAADANRVANSSIHIRNNTISGLIQGHGVPYQDEYSACFVNQFGGSGETESRYLSIGNVIRGNTCSGAQAGVLTGNGVHDLVYYPGQVTAYTMASTKGIFHQIVERNSFSSIGGKVGTIETHNGGGNDVHVPITVNHPNFTYGLSRGSNWTLVRNNLSDQQQLLDKYDDTKMYQPLLIVDDVEV